MVPEARLNKAFVLENYPIQSGFFRLKQFPVGEDFHTDKISAGAKIHPVCTYAMRKCKHRAGFSARNILIVKSRVAYDTT
jgi:hypothetical protein